MLETKVQDLKKKYLKRKCLKKLKTTVHHLKRTKSSTSKFLGKQTVPWPRVFCDAASFSILHTRQWLAIKCDEPGQSLSIPFAFERPAMSVSDSTSTLDQIGSIFNCSQPSCPCFGVASPKPLNLFFLYACVRERE